MQLASNNNDYIEFREFLEQACGILLGDNKEYLVNSRIKPVIARHNLSSLGELVTKLKSFSARNLKEEVIDAMTTNETLWFRDAHPFRILEEKIFVELESQLRSRPLNVWSAACSTGQEPYSISMIADEYKRKNLGKIPAGVRITATDISPSVLAAARSGIYEMLALGRGMSDDRLKRFFKSSSDGAWEVNADIKSKITFQSLNLLDNFARLTDRFDVIFCRNVLIYFSGELKQDILSRMHQKLQPGGYLILGASESLSGLSDKYEMVQCQPGIIYRAI